MVSILVPVYNVAPYIEKCARSLFEQTFKDVEYIFVNDCTPDNSVSILRNVIEDYPEVKDRLKIIDNDENMGLAAVRNIAVEAASGDFVFHVDSDDWIEPDAIQRLYCTAIEENADVVICDFNEIRKSASRIIENFCGETPREYTELLLKRKSLTHIIGKLLRKKLLTDNNLWTQPGLNQGEDYLMTPRIAYYSRKISRVSRPLYNYNRMNVASYTANVSDSGIDSVIEVQRRLVDFFCSLPDADKYWHTIDESCIYNKITCYYCAPFSSYKKVASLYKDIKWRGMGLKRKQKMIMSLSDAGCLGMIYMLVKTANLLKK